MSVHLIPNTSEVVSDQYSQAMMVPEVSVVTSPCCRRSDTVPLVVGVQFRVVAWPTVKVYPPMGILNGLAVLEAAATVAKMARAI